MIKVKNQNYKSFFLFRFFKKFNITKYDLLFISAIILIKVFLFNFNIIPSASMNPNLIEGDFVAVNKTAYYLDKPNRGDVITFEKDIYLVKRVVAVAGDSVEFINGRLYVNDEVMEYKSYIDPYIEERKIPYSKRFNFYPVKEKDHNGKEYSVLYLKNANEKLAEAVKPSLNFSRVIVPENSYFVAGDNRMFSKDSRFFGFVSDDELVGKPFLVITNFKFLLEWFESLFEDGENEELRFFIPIK